jgi:P4 family phage/plasmid primase-like protien
MNIDLDNIPAELKARPQWLCWQYKPNPKPNKKPLKVPYDPRSGKEASTTNPATWCSYAEAVAYYNDGANYSGIGYVFSADDGLCGIDLDDCLEDGRLAPTAEEIVQRFKTYTEVSPSGKGLKLILRGKKPASAECKSDGIEIYDRARYFAMTGLILDGYPHEIADRQDVLNSLCADLWPPKPAPAPTAAANAVSPGLRAKRCLTAMKRIRAADKNDGSNRLFACACRAVEHDLPDTEAVAIIRKYEAIKPFPRTWSDKEVLDRLRDAERKVVRGSAKVDDEDKDGPVNLTARLAAAIQEKHFFARDTGGGLYIFANGVYRPGGDKAVLRAVKHLMVEKDMEAWTSHRADEVVKFIAVDAPELWERPPLDVVNVTNGLLNVTTRELRQHDPGFLSPIQLPVAFDLSATCPAWEKFIADVFPADARTMPWEWVAWLMLPNVSIQKAVLLLGEGANGKSTFLTAIVTFLGPRNVTAISLHRLEADRFSTARLVGKLANICADLPSEHLAGTSVFKALTGKEGQIEAERKFQEGFEFNPYARLIFSANHPPRSADATYAFYRRWLAVPFTRTFEGKEALSRSELDARLADPKELSGVLNKALEALPHVLANGLSESESMRAAWSEFRGMTDPLAVWLDANTIDGPDLVVPKGELLAAYNAAARHEQRPTMAGAGFGMALKRLRPRIDEAQRTVNMVPRTWVWLGIGLRAPGGLPPDL